MFDWKNEEALRKACEGARSNGDILESLGYARNGGTTFKTLKKYATLYGIELPSFNRTAPVPKKRPLEEILVQDSEFNSGHLKARLLKEGVFKNRCYRKECLVGDSWLGNPITLQLEHKNGNPKDNRIENLELLCPNCHVQTSTWGRKKR